MEKYILPGSPPQRLRIAWISNAIHQRGGMERFAAELVDKLSPRHDIHVITAELESVQQERLVGLNLLSIPKKPFLRFFISFYREATAALKKAGEFDIVHTTGGIVAAQNFVSMQYCQQAWGDVLKHNAEARRGVNAYHQFMWWFAGYFERKACASPGTYGLTACSHQTANEIVKYYGTEREKIHVIYNAADIKRFHPDNVKYRSEVRERFQIPQDAFVFLFVGEYKRKGLNIVLQAISKIKTSTKIHLLAVGQGDIAAYQSLAASLGIAEQVRFVGPTANIEQVYGAADAFVFPTFYEPFGMVITEAMVSCVPVITSKSAGAAELIQSGQNGFLVNDPTNASEVAAQMTTVLGLSGEQRRELGWSGRESVSFQTWDRAAAMMENAYFDALERRGNRSVRT